MTNSVIRVYDTVEKLVQPIDLTNKVFARQIIDWFYYSRLDMLAWKIG